MSLPPARTRSRPAWPIVLAAALAFALPQLLLRANDAFCIREGEPCGCAPHFQHPRFLSLDLERIVPQALFALTLGFTGLRARRGRPAPWWLVAILSLSPIAVALVKAHGLEQIIDGVLTGADPSVGRWPLDVVGGFWLVATHVARTLFEQLEAMLIAAFAAGASLLAVAVVAALSSSAAEAPGAAIAEEARSRGGRFERWLADDSKAHERRTLLVGILGAVAAELGRVMFPAPLDWMDALSLALLLGAIPLALAMTRARASQGTPRSMDAATLGGLALVATAVLLGAPRLLLEVRAQLAVGASECDGWQWASPPPWMLPARLTHVAVDVLATAAIVVSAARSRALARPRLGWGARALLATAALLAIVTLAHARRVVRDIKTLYEPVAIADRAVAEAGVELPKSDPGARWAGYLSQPEPVRFLATRRGLTDLWPGPSRRDAFPALKLASSFPDHADLVAADASLPVESLFRTLGSATPRRRDGALLVLLAIEPRGMPRFDWGRPESIVGSPRSTWGVWMAGRLGDLAPERARAGREELAVVALDDGRARLVELLGMGSADLTASAVGPPIEVAALLRVTTWRDRLQGRILVGVTPSTTVQALLDLTSRLPAEPEWVVVLDQTLLDAAAR